MSEQESVTNAVDSDKAMDIEQVVTDAIQYAKKKGADHVEISARNDKGYSVSARLGDIETLEHHNQRALGVTVYRGKAKGSADSNDIRPSAIEDIIDAALSMASFTAEDEAAGLADVELMAMNYPELDLDRPWELEPDQALKIAMQCEETARADERIVNSEGASVSTIRSQSIYANSHDFLGHYASTRHSISCSVVAADEKGMQRDYWYSVARDADALDAVETIGLKARERTLRRLNARSLSTREVPVLFEPNIARSILGHFFSAINGAALYRDASFLTDDLGQNIFPDWLSISENPHIKTALASSPFDAEGVRTQARDIVSDGVLQGYILSSYSARKLNMTTTGNSGGVHNIRLPESQYTQDDLIKQMGSGVLLTELIGNGVNPVTGDYSRGAAGFWVENGEIQYPVQEITIAGNLKEMFQRIVAIGNDVDTCGGIHCGSMLMDQMTIAGSAE
jgi:PmbA protein